MLKIGQLLSKENESIVIHPIGRPAVEILEEDVWMGGTEPDEAEAEEIPEPEDLVLTMDQIQADAKHGQYRLLSCYAVSI